LDGASLLDNPAPPIHRMAAWLWLGLRGRLTQWGLWMMLHR
jgi:hypothetical protein